MTTPTTPRKRALIVDDNPDLLTIFSLGLGDAFDVATAVDGLDAMEKIAADCPDVVILDVNMPRMDGFEVLSALRTNPSYQHLKIILITGNSTVPSFPESGEADLVLSKPVSIDELSRLARRLLA